MCGKPFSQIQSHINIPYIKVEQKIKDHITLVVAY